jgi:bifunctional UDP-N-acetylglucosamine pyrophosphorylase/glucosamine-1-phosphate N-acetyltransferase
MADSVRVAVAGWNRLMFAVQEPQHGTGHALLQTRPTLQDRRGTLLLLSGDSPLLRTSTLEGLLAHHAATAAAVTVLSAIVERPTGYGRIVRNGSRVTRIVEERDATAEERKIHEINSGIYAFALDGLFDGLAALASHNAQGEYYLTDIVAAYAQRGRRVEGFTAPSPREVLGINSRRELAEVSTMIRQSKNDALMESGVTIEDPKTTYIDSDVTVGRDTVIHPGVYLEGQTSIGSGCEIHSGVRIVDSTIGDRVIINNFSVLTKARVADDARVGPFAHLRPDSVVLNDARVGNFVELKNTVLGPGSKANHLSYLGDATIGSQVNVGAGTITCNYDGERKHQTTIDDGAFIGSDSQLIAPVRVGRAAYVAAGSSITEDVPAESLGIARGRQVNKAGWARGRKQK